MLNLNMMCYNKFKRTTHNTVMYQISKNINSMITKKSQEIGSFCSIDEIKSGGSHKM